MKQTQFNCPVEATLSLIGGLWEKHYSRHRRYVPMGNKLSGRTGDAAAMLRGITFIPHSFHILKY